MIETIYIARHGFRLNWLPPPHPPNPTGIDSDPVLAPHGVEQAKELAAYLSVLPSDQKPQIIILSPFYRCVETSVPIANSLSLKTHIDTGVGEWFKPTRKVVPLPANYDQLREFFQDTLGNLDTWDGSTVTPSKDGEDEEAIFARAMEFWKVFFPKFEEQHPEITRVLFVTHAATKIALGMALMEYSHVNDEITFDGKKTKLRAGACSLDKYGKIADKWVLQENGRTDFLSGGEEMNWNFDVKFEAGSDEDIKARAAAAEKNGASKAKVPVENEVRV